MNVLLSTMWAQQGRFDAEPALFAQDVRRAGFDGIEVSHASGPAMLEALAEQQAAPIKSLHAPTPFTPSRAGRGNSSLNLASTDDGERTEAVEHHLRTIAWAARLRAGTVVVHLGGLASPVAEERRLRDLFNQGRIATDEARSLASAAHSERITRVAPHLDAARRSLTELVLAASREGVRIGLENRLHFHEIPSPAETAALLAEYSREQAGYWHDVGHLEVQARLGLVDARAALASLAPLLIGTHLHDVRGLVDHRAPGNGDVEWDYIAAALRPDTVRTCEIDQHEPFELLAATLPFLQERGVLAG